MKPRSLVVRITWTVGIVMIGWGSVANTVVMGLGAVLALSITAGPIFDIWDRGHV